ncbi:MAG: hypothetical protein KKH72_14070 [Alphaproteobacteria bacterium]|nr:hypothetical protein [Alphaproteobacteria bacterium]
MAAAAGSVPWFFAMEFRLQWRELWQGLLGTGGARRIMAIVFFVLILLSLHALANFLVGPFVAGGVTDSVPALASITASATFFVVMSLSQAIESVTRAYYTRGDFDLVLSSPAPARSVFWARTFMVTLTSAILSALMVSPFVNVLAWRDGARWLMAYPVTFVLSGMVTALAVFITIFLFRAIGPRHTRLAAQVASAVVGASLFVGIQTSLILSHGAPGTIAGPIADFLLFVTGGGDSLVWLPARAARGDWGAFALLAGVSAGCVALALHVSGKSFAGLALAALSETSGTAHEHKAHRFSGAGAMALLRQKEWRLVWRDPWLVSQSLMQLLYLVPLFALILFTAGDSVVAGPVLAAMLAMAAGQLSGGLAWLTISGEQAHDLVMTAPLEPRAIHLAKIEAIAAMVAVAILPVLGGLAFFYPHVLPVAAAGAVLASASAIIVQMLFRGRGDRRHFARREGSPRLATMTEALAATAWAGATGVAVVSLVAGAIAALPAMAIVLLVWLFRRKATPI